MFNPLVITTTRVSSGESAFASSVVVLPTSMITVWPLLIMEAACAPMASFSARLVVLVSSSGLSAAPFRRCDRATADAGQDLPLFEMFEVVPDRDLRNTEPVLEVGDADPAIDLDRPADRVVPQGGLECHRLIRVLHRRIP